LNENGGTDWYPNVGVGWWGGGRLVFNRSSKGLRLGNLGRSQRGAKSTKIRIGGGNKVFLGKGFD